MYPIDYMEVVEVVHVAKECLPGGGGGGGGGRRGGLFPNAVFSIGLKGLMMCAFVLF